jgi:hypothetical protein
VNVVVCPRLATLRAAVLKKKEEGFGMTIQSHEGVRGVLVGDITPHSPADLCPEVLPGDMIIAVRRGGNVLVQRAGVWGGSRE